MLYFRSLNLQQSTGAVVQPIMLNKFFNGNVGFHNGVRISAGINIILLVLATFLACTRLPPKKTQIAVSIPSLLREPAYASLVAAFVAVYFRRKVADDNFSHS